MIFAVKRKGEKMRDSIERQMALKTIGLIKSKRDETSVFSDDFDIISRIETMIAISNLPSARPDNKVNLCDSCKYNYPDCPSKSNDVIFGNGKGNDNICACNKYKSSAQLELIHCKHCKHGVHSGRGDTYLCTVSPEELSEHKYDFFCRYGESRED